MFPSNRVLGQATIDRLRHGAYKLVLDGASYRAPRTDDSGVGASWKLTHLPVEN